MLRWLLAAVLLSPAVLAQKWTVQYFYDQERTELQLTDLAFPTSERGIAIGTIYEREGKKPKYTALVTSDGGVNWALVPLKESPHSIFFLDESNGWLVTSEGIWHTAEAGRSWTRSMASPPDSRNRCSRRTTEDARGIRWRKPTSLRRIRLTVSTRTWDSWRRSTD